MQTDPVGSSSLVTQLPAQAPVQAQTQLSPPETYLMAPDTLSAYVGSAFTDTAVYTGAKVEHNKVLIDLNMVSNFLGLPGPKHVPKSDYRVNPIQKDDEQRQKDEEEKDENQEKGDQGQQDSDDTSDEKDKKDRSPEVAAQAVELAEQQKLADSVNAQTGADSAETEAEGELGDTSPNQDAELCPPPVTP
jgi:hypothetical protein